MIKSYEGDVTEPKDTRNPLASSTTNCAASFHRGVKQLYLAYITEKSKKYPEIKDGYTLIQRGIMISIPIPREYTGRKYTVKRQ